jgi:hypothetical protein
MGRAAETAGKSRQISGPATKLSKGKAACWHIFRGTSGDSVRVVSF